MSAQLDFLQQRQPGPAKPFGLPDIPFLLLDCQLRLQNSRVLRPTDGHDLGQHLRRVLVGAVELPHPTPIPGRETGDVGRYVVQILRRRNSGAFLRPAADQPANFTAQFHLRKDLLPSACPAPRTGRCDLWVNVHPTSSLPAQMCLFSFLPRFKSLNLSQFKGLNPIFCLFSSVLTIF